MNFEKFEQLPIADQNAQPKEETQPQKDWETLGRREEEIKLEEVVAERIQSAEIKVFELTDDGQKRIDGVEQSVGLPAEDIAAVREEIGVFGRLGKIRGEARGLFGRLKEKFSGLFAKEKLSDDAMAETERPEYDELKEYLKHEQREISRPVIEEAKRKRDQLLEARGLLSMSKTDFDTYFSSKDFEVRADLKQQNVGDCYAVAAIHAMSCSPHFEMICRSSMKRNPDGSWQVKVPLMSEDGQAITITPEELSPQWNKKFLRRKAEGGVVPDLRMRLMPVKGKEGLQVIEAAFIKAKFGSVDRLAAEGGWGDEVLLQLGGDNFVQYRLNSAKYDPEEKKWEYPGLDSLDEEQQAYLDHYLENFDPEIHMATVSTKSGNGKTTGFYKATGTMKFLVRSHAYSISGVDAENKVVILANPWNTSKPLKLTFEQFKESFSGFEAIRINSAKLLRNMKGVEKSVT